MVAVGERVIVLKPEDGVMNAVEEDGEDDDTTALPSLLPHRGDHEDRGKGKGSSTRSTELELVKRKFEVVDEWAMEFESVSVGEEGGGHRRSSPTWR